MLLSATNAIGKHDVQLRKEDESQWIALGVVWWSAVTAQQKGSGFESTLSMMSLGVNRGKSMFMPAVTHCHSKSIGIEPARASPC